jgi:hypothetical protein
MPGMRNGNADAMPFDNVAIEQHQPSWTRTTAQIVGGRVTHRQKRALSLNSQEFSRTRPVDGLNSCEFSYDESEAALSC